MDLSKLKALIAARTPKENENVPELIDRLHEWSRVLLCIDSALVDVVEAAVDRNGFGAKLFCQDCDDSVGFVCPDCGSQMQLGMALATLAERMKEAGL